MSGGEYQLLRTDSQDDTPWEPYPIDSSSTLRTRALLDRLLRAFSRLTSNHKSTLLSSTRLSRSPDAVSSSSFFTVTTKPATSSAISRPRRRKSSKLLLLFSFLMGLFVMSTLFWTPWGGILDDVFYVQNWLPPSTACLLDPLSPSSYVHWNPDSRGIRNVYHCITQRIPAHQQQRQSLKQSPHHQSSLAGSALRTWRPLPDSCLDAYYTNGSSCSDGQRTTFDIVWTWVNGSDPMILKAKAHAKAELKRQQQQQQQQKSSGRAGKHAKPQQQQENDDQAEQQEEEEEEAGSAHLYRDHDELRHSLRSVLQNFRNSATKFIVLTSDFVFPDAVGYLFGGAGPVSESLSEESGIVERGSTNKKKKSKSKKDEVGVVEGEEEEEEATLDEEKLLEYARLGLLPQWLQFNLPLPPPDELGEGEGEVDVREEGENVQVVGRWKDGDIPLEIVHHAEVYEEYDGTVFNSNSIESQLGNVVGDKAFIYFNDDCFFNAPLSSGDFHTSAYGLVFRMVAFPWMLVRPQHYPADSALGEWHPMEFTNYIITKRFGARRRPYPMHQVKVLQGSLMREMWTMWNVQERLNMGHKFRGLGGLESVKEDRTEWEELDPVERGRSVASEDEDGRPREEEEEVDEDLVEVKRMLKEELTRFSKRNDIGLSSSEQLLRRNEEQAKERRAVDLLEDEEDEEPGNDQGGSTFVEGEQQIEDDGDAHVMFLFTHFVVERSREGMLWSWIVASLGTDEDEFGEEQRETAWRVLTKDVEVDADTEETMVEHPQRGTRSLDVLVERRHTMEPWRIGWRLGESGDHLEGATYLFSSQDGDAYSYYDDMDGVEWCAGSTCWPQLWNGDYFPTNVTDRQKWASCTIDWDVCFDPKIQRAGELFRHVAFGKRECGDCILKALVRASGPLGLSALLPSPERIYHHRRKSGDDGMAKGTVPVGSDHVSPHLPLTTEWRSTDFSLSSVFASGFWDQPHGVRLREWVQRLLEKYRYVLADTDNIFMVIHDPVDAERTFADVDDHPSVPLVTINDDVNESHEKTDRRIREWLGQRWSTPAAWENPDALPVFSPNYDSFYRKRSLDGDHR